MTLEHAVPMRLPARRRTPGVLPLVVGLGIPLGYQIGLTIFAFTTPVTLLPPPAWVALHTVTALLFLTGPLAATRLAQQRQTGDRPSWRRAASAIGFARTDAVSGAAIVALGVAAVFAFQIIYPLVLAGVFHTSEDFGFTQSSQDLVPFLVLGVVLGPLGEETFFRGYLGSLLPPLPFVLVSATLWSVMHVDPLAAAPLVWAGVVFAVMRTRSGSLYPSLIAHMAFNALALAVFFWWK